MRRKEREVLASRGDTTRLCDKTGFRPLCYENHVVVGEGAREVMGSRRDLETDRAAVGVMSCQRVLRPVCCSVIL